MKSQRLMLTIGADLHSDFLQPLSNLVHFSATKSARRTLKALREMGHLHANAIELTSAPTLSLNDSNLRHSLTADNGQTSVPVQPDRTRFIVSTAGFQHEGAPSVNKKEFVLDLRIADCIESWGSPRLPNSLACVTLKAECVERVLRDVLLDMAIANSPIYAKCIGNAVEIAGSWKAFYASKAKFARKHSNSSIRLDDATYFPFGSFFVQMDNSAYAHAIDGIRILQVWDDFLLSVYPDAIPRREIAFRPVFTAAKVGGQLRPSLVSAAANLEMNSYVFVKGRMKPSKERRISIVGEGSKLKAKEFVHGNPNSWASWHTIVPAAKFAKSKILLSASAENVIWALRFLVGKAEA